MFTVVSVRDKEVEAQLRCPYAYDARSNISHSLDYPLATTKRKVRIKDRLKNVR